MTLLQSISRLFSGANAVGLVSAGNVVIPPQAPLDDQGAITQYRVMRAMYDANGLYEDLRISLNQLGLWKEAMLPLRNPANRVAEFYASKVCPGANLTEALPILGANRSLENAIHQVWTWSNWAAQKQVAVRFLAIYGDLFIKVVGSKDPDRVFFQLLQPENTTDIDVDERGFLTYVRLDVPFFERQADTTQKLFMATEVWDKGKDSFRKWIHQNGPGADITKLGQPVQDFGIKEQLGFGFIPIVQGKFRDTGDLRGAGSYAHAFDKIIEADRSATRLHQLLFRNNKVTWAVTAGGVDANMRPLPAPIVDIGGGSSPATRTDNTLDIGDDVMYRLPGNSDIKPLIPQLPYADALAILNAHLSEIERDLPELAYYRLRDMGASLSGRAVRLMLSDAVDRVLEARGNFEAALVRADQIALTIAKNTQIQGINVQGTFEEGDFEHSFDSRPVIPTSDLEDAQAQQAQAAAELEKVQLGLSKKQALRNLGYSDAEIQKISDEKAAEDADIGAALLDNFNRGNVPFGNQQSA